MESFNTFQKNPDSRVMKVFIPFQSFYDPSYHRCLEVLWKIGYEEAHLIQMVALDLISRDQHYPAGRRKHVEDVYTAIDYCDIEMFHDNLSVDHQQSTSLPTLHEAVEAFEEGYVAVYTFMEPFFQGLPSAMGYDWHPIFVSIDNAVPGCSFRDRDLDLIIEFQRLPNHQSSRQRQYEAGI